MKKLENNANFLANQVILFSMASAASALCITQVENIALKISNAVCTIVCILIIWYLKAQLRCDVRNADTELENFVNVAMEHMGQTKTLEQILDEDENHIPKI